MILLFFFIKFHPFRTFMNLFIHLFFCSGMCGESIIIIEKKKNIPPSKIRIGIEMNPVFS